MRLGEYYGNEEVRAWLYARHPQLDGARAIDLIHDGRTEEVIAKLDRLDADAYLQSWRGIVGGVPEGFVTGRCWMALRQSRWRRSKARCGGLCAPATTLKRAFGTLSAVVDYRTRSKPNTMIV